MRLASLVALLATPALSDVSEVLSQHIVPGHARLVQATAALDAAAEADCRAESLHPAYHAAYDAWIAVSHIQFGPIEDQGLNLAMAYWPDPKNSTGKALSRLSSARDPVVDTAEGFDEVSAAAQGFSALERLLFESQPDADYACRLTRAITDGLARKSARLSDGWDRHATLMRQAGETGNARYQSTGEVQRTLYTALLTGLEFLHDQRLGRPLGTYDRPRPRRAEARRSGRSLRHVEGTLATLHVLATLMAETETPRTTAAFQVAQDRAAALNDPTLAGVADPATRFRVEVLQNAVRAIQVAVVEEIGRPMGLSAGFNALDGD